MHGVNPTSELLSQLLQGTAPVVGVDPRSVHEQSGRLVYRNQMIVLKKNRQHELIVLRGARGVQSSCLPWRFAA